MIKFSINGGALDPRNLKDAVMASVLESIREQIRQNVGHIRDPDTGEFPTIIIRGDSLENLKIQVEGSPAVIALVNERLGLESMPETTATSEGHPSVFISYTSEDIEIARRVAEALEGAGIEVWWDKWCISAGDSLRRKIDEGIGGCTHFLALLTPRSITKPWVNQEMDAALVRKLNDQCRFLPVRHELPSSQLPPLLSGIASPAITTDADIAQLINDIHGLTRRPHVGRRQRRCKPARYPKQATPQLPTRLLAIS
jgi:TIR domain